MRGTDVLLCFDTDQSAQSRFIFKFVWAPQWFIQYIWNKWPHWSHKRQHRPAVSALLAQYPGKTAMMRIISEVAFSVCLLLPPLFFFELRRETELSCLPDAFLVSCLSPDPEQRLRRWVKDHCTGRSRIPHPRCWVCCCSLVLCDTWVEGELTSGSFARDPFQEAFSI